MYSTRRKLREELYMAHNTLCIKDNDTNNLKVCQRLINLRREMAQLLGYDTYADYVMKYRMATSVENVYKLLNDLINAYKPTAIEERNEVMALAKEMEGDDFKLMPWDVAYYSHQLKMRKYDLDPEMLRPYLELNNVIKGVFGLATRLYGITFKENKDIPVYHPDVRHMRCMTRTGATLPCCMLTSTHAKGSVTEHG